MLRVSKNGKTKFHTIKDALIELKQNPYMERTIFIEHGVYEECVEVFLDHVTLIGESEKNTIISSSYGANMLMEDGSKRGTFRTYTVLIDASDVTIQHITIQNTAGSGEVAGQAIALYADGDRLILEDCRLLGNQDTLFTGPLPPSEKEANGFVGPKQFAPRIVGRQYYKNCYIEGDVDFIFGSARAYFECCEIFSKNRGKEINGYVTAASTPKEEPYGYIFYQCHFTSNCPKESVYLGRPWREYAKTVLIYCQIEEHVCKEGWHDWNKPFSHETTFYAEYENTGSGSDIKGRVSWSHKLENIEVYTKKYILSGQDNWTPFSQN